MRPSRTVARAVLTAALALGALPGLVGSHEPSPDRPIDAAAFRQVVIASSLDRARGPIAAVDDVASSAGLLSPIAKFSEGADRRVTFPARPNVRTPEVSSGWSWKPPKSTLSGTASFYTNGTTAMRLPRGTVIVICGATGCLERIVNDYGPAAWTGRVIDMYKPDFLAICGCTASSGLTHVTIRIYGIP